MQRRVGIYRLQGFGKLAKATGQVHSIKKVLFQDVITYLSISSNAFTGGFVLANGEL